MSRSDTIRTALLVVVLLLLVSTVALGVIRLLPLAVVAGVLGLAAVVGWHRHHRSQDGDPATEGSGRSVWDAIPGRQYDGRYAHSGGLARSEQERALESIQQEAEEATRERSERPDRRD